LEHIKGLEMLDGLIRLAIVALILIGIGSIVVFFRVFQRDFNERE